MDKRPNILIFMTDQQRGDTAPRYGRAVMPNLEKLSAEGVSFSRAFCTAPHCCPSRASFLSGLYPSQHGVWNNVDVGNALSRGLFDGVRLFGEDLKDAGYSLHYSGKWHVSAVETPADRGWTTTMRYRSSAESAFRSPMTSEWARYGRLEQGSGERGEGEMIRPGYGNYTHYGTSENPFDDRSTVDDALKAIKARGPSEGPWCQMVATVGPHDPYFVPKRFLDMYCLDKIKLPPSFADRMEDKPALYRRTRARFDQLSEREHREALRHYLAFCSYQDSLFGELLGALEACGELDNTLVLYLSDHGDYAAEHGLWCKGLPSFSSAYHIPAVARLPGRISNPGRAVNSFVSIADFAPTLLDVAGIRTDRKVAGRSLLPFFRSSATPEGWRDAIFAQSNGNELYGIQRIAMTDKWRYVYNGFDFDELYDLEHDPGQTVNLIDDPLLHEAVKEMCERLWSFARENDDVCVNSYVMVALAPWGPGLTFGGA